MPATLMLGGRNGRLVDLSRKAGDPWQVPRVARALAAGDLDNDGRIDLVLSEQNGPLAFFHNAASGPSRSITLKLEGTTSNRDGVGAVVTVTAGDRKQRLPRLGGGSFQSASDGRIHAGLGRSPRADVEVRWPSGRVDRHPGLQAGLGYRLREGDAQTAPLVGFPRP